MRVFRSGLLAVGILAIAVPALGNQCVANAAADNVACKKQCQSDFLAAKLVCGNIDPTCGTACLAGRQACLDNVQAILDTGLLPDGTQFDSVNCSGGTDQCKATFAAAKAACNPPCQPADTTCKDCVDAAQVADLTCRDTCRDSWRVNATVNTMLGSCTTAFNACKKACPKIR